MRHHSFTLFDEYVPASTTTFTSTDFNARLGAFDQIALHAVFDNISATGKADIFVEHSGDARNWIQRNSMQLGTPTPSTNGDISVDLAANVLFQLVWADAGASSTGSVRYTGTTVTKDTSNTPFLPFVRLRIVLGSGTGAHVKIHATLRGAR